MTNPRLDFKSLHDQFRPRVLRYIARLVGDADAEDLTQSVMLKVSEGLAGFRGDSSVSTWIYRIATNVALDRLRQKRSPISEAGGEFDEDGIPETVHTDSAEQTAVRGEMSACIGEFVARLPENYKTVMILSDLEGFKNDEIATMLGITLDAVKIRLHRARQRLRKDLQDGCTFYRDDSTELACDRKPSPPIIFPRHR